MKSTGWIFLVASLVATGAAAETALKTDKEKLSYSLGAQIGQDIKRNEVDIDVDMFSRAMREAISGAKAAMTDEEIRNTMQTFQQTMREKAMVKMQEMGNKNKKASDEFLAANKTKEGVKTLPSGVQYQVIATGKGKKPTPTDQVVAHYTGTLIDGTEFDSSVKRGEPATFPLNGVIKGWQEVLPLMSVGSKWKIYVPPELGYGPRGAGQQIGPNQALIFDIELLDVKKATMPPKAEKKAKPAKPAAKPTTPAEKPADAVAPAQPATSAPQPATPAP